MLETDLTCLFATFAWIFEVQGELYMSCSSAPSFRSLSPGNIDISVGCGVGDCGTCEIEMLPQKMWVRSCVVKVPAHKDEVTFDVVGSDIPAF